MKFQAVSTGENPMVFPIIALPPHMTIALACLPQGKLWAFSIFNVVSNRMFYSLAHRDETDASDDLITNALVGCLKSLTVKTVNSLKRELFNLDSLREAVQCGRPLRLEIVSNGGLKALVNRLRTSPSDLAVSGRDARAMKAIRTLDKYVTSWSDVSMTDPRIEALIELMDEVPMGSSEQEQNSPGYRSYMGIVA
jgi:hypothetical protein